MAKRRMLIVDDEPDFLRVLMDYFRPLGYVVDAADNLEDALELFQKHKPKVVLLDFKMPIIHGDEFLPVLQGVDPTVRVIVITGFARTEVEEKFKGLGYFAFFEKAGLSLEKVRQKVDEALTD
ncbi:MAG: response regulator [Candidatus Omnitrophica bacterium]|nr:response regulator [Candidatus Omnitrophota bacterium]